MEALTSTMPPRFFISDIDKMGVEDGPSPLGICQGEGTIFEPRPSETVKRAANVLFSGLGFLQSAGRDCCAFPRLAFFVTDKAIDHRTKDTADDRGHPEKPKL